MIIDKFIKKASLVAPSARQLAWQEMEFYSFIHFGVNTFTDSEWGDGNEDAAIFNPTSFDANQWVKTVKDAGMKGLILTCKHHDGFCLWPSTYTEHSVKNSPWKGGKGDIVDEVSQACKRAGIKFGVYLSPWDRHEKTYGDSDVYNEYFKNQLTELLTNYGEVFCVWFDGACGEGLNGKKQVYAWNEYYKLIRELQPNAVINVCGPDVRWCGNEAGNCRKSEWSVVPSILLDVEKIQDESQKVDDGKFTKKINSGDEDLGGREVIKTDSNLVWYPAEVNTSIRPGWFYHASEDEEVKTLHELLEIYYGSVGGNSSFLLNIPPDKRGLINDNDVTRLREFGDTIKSTFKTNLAKYATAKASETIDDLHDAKMILDGKKDTYWCPKEGTEKVEIIIDLKETKAFDRFVLMEHIALGQRIESFVLEFKDAESYKEFYNGTIVGYKRICCFNIVTTRYLKIKITASRWCPTIENIGVFLSK